MRRPLLILAMMVLPLITGTAALAAPLPAQPALAQPALAKPEPATVMMVNGDRLAVRSAPDGGQLTVLLPPVGGAGFGSVLSLRLDGQLYDIPADALPFLGRGLAPSLFELSALRRAETSGRLPVRVAFAGRRPALPGAAAAPSATTRPAFPMHTLTVTCTNLAGKPDTGDSIELFELGNPERLGQAAGEGVFYHGAARFSVPAGHYWALATFVSMSGAGRPAPPPS